MKNIFLLLICFYSITIFSQSKKRSENPIITQLNKCLNKKDISNAEMCNCSIKARDAWDKELNKYYTLLLTKLPESAKTELKESQRQWINYRDKEFSFISKYYYEVKEGTMWYFIAENKKTDFVKDRALELEDYFETLDY